LAAAAEKKRKQNTTGSTSVEPPAQRARAPAVAEEKEEKQRQVGASGASVKVDTVQAEENGLPVPLRFLEDVFGLKFSTLEKEVQAEKEKNPHLYVASIPLFDLASKAQVKKDATWETEFKMMVGRVKAKRDAQGNAVSTQAREDTARLQKQTESAWGSLLTSHDVLLARQKMLQVGAALYFHGRRASTMASQDSAVKTWEYFCDTFMFEAYPATEMSLICFVVWSMSRNIQASSIGTYLSSIRSRHMEEGAYLPSNKEMPRLMRVLDGLKWVAKATEGGKLRLPCTFDVLERILISKWTRELEKAKEERPSIYSMDSAVLASAVYCLAFCGCLRPSELSVRVNTGKRYTSLPLRLRDIKVDAQANGIINLILWLPKRKNDQLGEKSDVSIGPTGHELVCAVRRLMEYLQARRDTGEELTEESLLFPVDDTEGRRAGLTYEQLTRAMDADLEAAGFDSKLYGGHSWRIGAATSLALNGVPEYLIKDIGGWSRSSSAFNVYIGRAPQKQRASYTCYLAKPYSPNASQGFSYWTQGVTLGQAQSSCSVDAVGPARGAFGAAASALLSAR
jgi:hypothetical protein